MSQKKDIKLTYFPATARGELSRLVLVVAGQDFEDERIAPGDWPTLKPTTPFGTLPILTVTGKKTVACQNGSIARYLAKKFNFYGSNPWEELLCDEAVECVNDLITEWSKFFFEKDEEKKTEMKEKFNETIAKFIAYIRLRKENDGKNGYIVGSKLSVADLAVFNFIDQQIFRGETCYDSHDDIMNHFNMVKNNARIKKYLENRPPSMF